ncbi:MAG: MaoC/PaaZ C-terminal domain-containing protein, partial [Mycobacterium sp.]
LCTYGMTCKALVDTVLDGEATQVSSYGARFAGVVFPGETSRASIWRDGDRYVGVVTAPGRDNVTVLSDVELVPA